MARETMQFTWLAGVMGGLAWLTALEGREEDCRQQAAEARVVGCAGPWRVSGEWWDAGAWARDEWDVALSDGAVCRLARDAAPADYTWSSVISGIVKSTPFSMAVSSGAESGTRDQARAKK